MRIINFLIGTTLTIGLLSGCTNEAAASSEEIVSNVLEAGKKIDDYYGKATLKIFTDEKETEYSTMEEYVGKNGERKTVTTDHKRNDQKAFAYNDGKTFITYDEESKKALSADITADDLPTSMTQKEQLTSFLEHIKDTHKHEVVGEEKVLGLDTYHLKITPNSKDSLFGEMEVWVDKKTWFIVKVISNSGDIRTEIEYKEVDFTPDFTKNTFEVNLPKDVEVSPIESEFPTNTGTIEEAEQALGQPFLLLNDDNQEIHHIEWNVLEGELNRTEIVVLYTKDKVSSLSLSIFPTPVGKDMEIEESKWKVRGHIADYMEIEELRILSWDEDGLRYSIMIEDPSLKIEKVIEMAESMQYKS
ncbi:LolA family protein [Metabacillus sp. FJAT-53654]|uniref:Outer membrane lipoprotein-sorting protein n=1 Tax=Metabacillus rhizosphaerae TaxID=3117747 RepID=A0ABZ2MMM4_9BACI